MNAGDPFVAPVDPLRAEEVMHESLQTPLPGRIAVIEQLCGGDTALFDEVKSLLRHLPDPENPDDPDQPLGEVKFEEQVIGGCRVESLLGRGGTGRVFKAMQEWPPRPVAVKILRPELLTESARRRFRRETRALARLDHPGVARIHAAGLHRLGGTDFPFVIMELVADAKTLTEWWRSTDHPLHDRLLLFAHVCEAVHHGHVRGLVHRDLKPSNVLVDGAGTPKVIDFGIAAVTTDEGAPTTITRAVAGTPGYMAPEQFEAGSQIDQRSDVHALGLLLYECLAGKPAFAREGLSMAAAARSISDTSPTPLGVLDARLRGDLETIAQHAMAKDPATRYQSAFEMAADLRRHTSGHPIVARPVSMMHRGRLFARRNPVAAVALVFAAAALAIGVSASMIFGLNEQRAATMAQQALARAEHSLWVARLSEFSRAVELRDPALLRISNDTLASDTSWPVRLLRALSDESVARFDGNAHFENFSAMGGAVSPDGSVLALVMDAGNGVALLDATDLHQVRILSPGIRSWAVTFDPVHERLVTADGTRLFVWDKPWMDPPRIITLPGDYGDGIAASPDGTRVAVSAQGNCCVIDLDTGAVVARTAGTSGSTTRVAWSPDGQWIAMGVEPRSVRLLHAADLSEAARIPTDAQRTLALAFDPSSRWLAFAGDMRVLHVCEVQNPTNERRLRLDHSVWGMAWKPHGQQLALADRGSGVRLVRVPDDGAPLSLVGSYSGHPAEIWCVDWNRGGDRLYSIGQFGVRAWSDQPHPGPRAHELGASALGLHNLSSGGSAVLTSDATLWTISDETNATPQARWRGGPFQAVATAGNPSHDRWAWIDSSSHLRMLHGDTSRRIDVSLQPFEEFPARMAFSPDGRLLAITGNSMKDPLVIVDAATGVERSRLQVPWKNQPSGLLWLDDTRLLAGDFNDGFTVERRGDSAWAVGRSMPGYWTGMRSIGGNRVVVCALGGQLVERDVRTGERGREYDGMSDMARTAAISPDGSLLAAVGTDRRLHIFDTRTSEQLLSIMGHATGRMVTDVIFCADGSRVLTIDNAGGLLDWDTREHRPATTANQ